MSEKTLERIVSHAMHCELDDELEFYAYEAEGVFLLFNSVYNLVQVSFDGVTSLRSELLTSNQKVPKINDKFPRCGFSPNLINLGTVFRNLLTS